MPRATAENITPLAAQRQVGEYCREALWDLETKITSLTCLADVASFLVENVVGGGNRRVSDRDAEMLAFAVYETQQKARHLYETWLEAHNKSVLLERPN